MTNLRFVIGLQDVTARAARVMARLKRSAGGFVVNHRTAQAIESSEEARSNARCLKSRSSIHRKKNRQLSSQHETTPGDSQVSYSHDVLSPWPDAESSISLRKQSREGANHVEVSTFLNRQR
jgi:hypothetical protein